MAILYGGVDEAKRVEWPSWTVYPDPRQVTVLWCGHKKDRRALGLGEKAAWTPQPGRRKCSRGESLNTGPSAESMLGQLGGLPPSEHPCMPASSVLSQGEFLNRAQCPVC